MIKIVVDSHLRIDGLSTDWLKGLAKLCSIQNEEKLVAQREHVWGADFQDDLLTLAEIDGSELVLPRGFLNELTEMLDDSGYDYKVIYETVHQHSSVLEVEKSPTLKEDQALAVQALAAARQGRIIAPPGLGKTVIGLHSALYSGQRTLILVDKKHIAQQWVDRAEEHFDTEIGFIGDNRWEEQKITVALIQTLWSRQDDLDGWWDKWGCVMLDEQHHIPAETYTNIVSRFKAYRRFGLSATVGKSEGKKRISELIFGPILYESTQSALKPLIKIVETGFDFGYHPTHKLGKRVIRNNYQDMMNALIKDTDRNVLIAEKIMENESCANLIVSNRLDHLEAIRGLVENGSNMNCYHLTGNETLDERMEIYELADKANCAVFSTLGVAGEALDIPRLDRIHLTYPMKNEETVWQVIGRGARVHENKESCIIFDYRDTVSVLRKQQLHRLRKVYQQKELKVEIDEG